MKAKIICGDAFEVLARLKPAFILTDAPHDALRSLSKFVEAHRLTWVNASSPQWLTLEHTGEKLVLPYLRLVGGIRPDVICDPFMGWGTIGQAALMKGCDFIGVDNKPDRCAYSAKRLAKMIGVELETEGF